MTSMTRRYLLLLSFCFALESSTGFQSVLIPHGTAVTSRSLIAQSANNNDNNDAGRTVSDSTPYPPEFHRAVECAKNQGLCDVDELIRLADELEAYDDSCFFEVEKIGQDGDCEKEVLDRLDVADLLRAESETAQRRDTLEFSNLFTDNVEKHEDDAPTKDVIDCVSNYYECVYSKTGNP